MIAGCSDATSVTVCAEVNAPGAGAAVTVGATVSGGVNSATVTFTAAAVVWLLAASRAAAVSVWTPLTDALASQVMAYGGEVISAPRFAPSSFNCTPTTATLSFAVADTVTAVGDTIAPLWGAVIDTSGLVVSVPSAATTTSKFAVPSVQISPIWFPAMRGYPEMKLRVCVPLPVPGTVVQGVHAAPSNLLYRIELAPSLLTQNSQMLVPSLAPNTPAPFFDVCPTPNSGGAGDIERQVLDPAT